MVKEREGQVSRNNVKFVFKKIEYETIVKYVGAASVAVWGMAVGSENQPSIYTIVMILMLLPDLAIQRRHYHWSFLPPPCSLIEYYIMYSVSKYCFKFVMCLFARELFT
jgi:hypothetical protein